MKRGLITALLIWILFLLQTTVFQFLKIASTAPNLLLILVVSTGFLRGKREGMLTGFFAGLLVDLFYGSWFGFYALVLMYVGYLCGKLYNVYFEENIRMPLILVAAGDLGYGIAVYAVHFFLRGRVRFFSYLWRVILPEIVYTCLIAIILYRILYLINRSLSKNEERGVKNEWLKG